jgi:hypothetical protein
LVYLLVFHAYINEMHDSRSKIPSKKNLVRQHCTEGCSSGVKGLMVSSVCSVVSYSTTLLSCCDTCICLLQVIVPRAVELDHLVEEMTEFYSQEENRDCHALKEVH